MVVEDMSGYEEGGEGDGCRRRRRKTERREGTERKVSSARFFEIER